MCFPHLAYMLLFGSVELVTLVAQAQARAALDQAQLNLLTSPLDKQLQCRLLNQLTQDIKYLINLPPTKITQTISFCFMNIAIVILYFQ